jgi:hypothetical protein
MGMIRWWNELRDPRLKCERLGHYDRIETRRIMVTPARSRELGHPTLRCVAVVLKRVVRRCSCCGKTEVLRHIYDHAVQSLSLPDPDWNQLSTTGEIPWDPR